ncbi:hypothetical protein GCM10007424_14410 [Flavobacterium suaedae]|uniref:Uncharacterized protein n=1 Tax=Flavobacterium suaedae TaxID=1767027 RepID=A0ABQ1JVH4_9FLAO|nr:hypothetical protein [Flavobacterium suaedae]GGB75583.1 hypothetical protein GCM10007424_14410 [Flavobacterium suaedae]
MNYIPEIIIAALLVTGILIYYLNGHAYKKQKVRFLAKYRRARIKSLHFQDALSAYILRNNAKNEVFVEGLTYGEFLKQLQKHHSLYLSEKRYKKLRRSPLIIGKDIKAIEKQEARLSETEKKIATIKEQKSSA